MASPTDVRSGVVAPDGGWGWFVVLGAFLLQALTVGTAYTFGVIYVELLDVFGESKSTTAWVGSIQMFLLYFSGMLHVYTSIYISGTLHVYIFVSTLAIRFMCTSATYLH